MFTWFEDSEQIVSYNWFSENSIQILRFEKSTSFLQRQLIKFSPALNIYFCCVLRNLKFAGELTANFFWDWLLVCCSLPLNSFILCSLVIFRSPFVIFVVLYCPQIILSVKKLEYKMALTILNGKCNKTFSRHTNIVQKKCCKKSLEAGFFLMHWPSLLYGYWFSNDYFLLAYAFGKRVIMGPKYFSGPVWIFKLCETIISILSKYPGIRDI